MSGDRTGPRYEVVATTRRSWTKAQKLAIVAEIGIGGATLSEVARRHGIHASLLFRWRRDLVGDSSARQPDAPDDIVVSKPATRPALTFVPVVVPREQPSTEPSPKTDRSSMAGAPSAMIEIVLAGGRVLRVGADVDTAALMRIVVALDGIGAVQERGR